MKKILFFFVLAASIVSCAPKSAPVAEEVAAPVNHAAYASADQEAQQRVYDYLKAHGPFFIATVDGDQARVRPFGALHIFEGKMYIITGHSKRGAQQLAKNPKVELCAQSNNEWIRVTATIVEDERIEAKKAVLDAFPNLRSMYNENDDNIAVYYFTNATATLSSFAGDEKTLNF